MLKNKDQIKFNIYLLSVCIGILIFDSYQSRQFFQDKIESINNIKNTSILLNNFMDNKNKIIYVYPKNAPNNWLPLSLLALEKDLDLNFIFSARIDGNQLKSSIAEIENSIKLKKFDKSALYYFNGDITNYFERESPSNYFIFEKFESDTLAVVK